MSPEPIFGLRCPWCGRMAVKPSSPPVICESRICDCGAIALAAPSHDTDEIIDDAINVLGGIEDAFMTPHDSDRVAGLRRLGVDIVEGEMVAADRGTSPFDLRVLWFRYLHTDPRED